jgi:hypothetical protein
MSQYSISASVTSPPTDVFLHINNVRVNMVRDSTGGWSGKARLDLPDSVPIAFRAVGLFSAPWSLEIKFSTLPPHVGVLKDYKHADTIPDSLLSIFADTVNLTGAVTS